MSTMARVTNKMVAAAVDRFFERPEVASNMEILSRRLPAAAQILVAGGAIRNLIIAMMHGSAPPTKDIDIFIGGLDRDFNLAAMLNDQTVRSTDLGGLRWQPALSAYAHDLCLLHDFLVIHTYRREPTQENLLAGIDFTINAIIYDYRRRALVEHGCLAAIRDRVIDFNSRLIPDKCLIAYRILLMADKTGFRLSEAVFEFLTQRMDIETLVRLKRLLRVKQGKRQATSIMGDLDRLCKQVSYAGYLKGLSIRGECP
jgi:hypothetical protein